MRLWLRFLIRDSKKVLSGAKQRAKNGRLRLPDLLPLIIGLTAGISFLCSGFGSLIYTDRFGRPSSTDVVGLVTIPVISVVIGLVAAAIGFGVRLLWNMAGFRFIPVRRSVVAAICGIVIAAALALGVAGAMRYELAAGAAVILDRSIVEQIKVRSNYWTISRSATQISLADPEPEPFGWGDARTVARINPEGLSLRDEHRNQECVIAIPGLDYVTSVEAAELAAPDSDPKLVLLIRGRPSGHRAILAILSSDYVPLYVERMVTFWQQDDSPLAIGYSDKLGSEVVVIGSSRTKESKAYAPRSRGDRRKLEARSVSEH
jgi:hypothetical protein